MNFAEIPDGAVVFIDANTFVYHFIHEPSYGAACTALLERIERREIVGWSSPHIFAEVSHRLMTIEAISTLGWPYQGIANHLRRRPESVRGLVRFRQAVAVMCGLELKLPGVTHEHVLKASELSVQHGLLTNDALVIALMQDNRLTNLASGDADFDRVPWVHRFFPL